MYVWFIQRTFPQNSFWTLTANPWMDMYRKSTSTNPTHNSLSWLWVHTARNMWASCSNDKQFPVIAELVSQLVVCRCMTDYSAEMKTSVSVDDHRVTLFTLHHHTVHRQTNIPSSHCTPTNQWTVITTNKLLLVSSMIQRVQLYVHTCLMKLNNCDNKMKEKCCKNLQKFAKTCKNLQCH